MVLGSWSLVGKKSQQKQEKGQAGIGGHREDNGRPHPDLGHRDRVRGDAQRGQKKDRRLQQREQKPAAPLQKTAFERGIRIIHRINQAEQLEFGASGGLSARSPLRYELLNQRSLVKDYPKNF
jgi:hypothetical protein